MVAVTWWSVSLESKMEYLEQNTRRSSTRNKPMAPLATVLGQVPPQAVELEAAVLGALMLKKDAIFEVLDFLKPESFYKDAHAAIYASIISLKERSEPVDMLTVSMELRRMGKLDVAGGQAYVVGLTNRLNSTINLVAHARFVQEMAIKRDLIKVSSQIAQDAYEDTNDVFELLDRSEQQLFEILNNNVKGNTQIIKDVINQAMDDLALRRNQKDGITGVPSGFNDLDNLTAGWQSGALIIIAARPAMGKTAFVLSVSRNAAVDWGKAVAIFSLEMPSVDLAMRLMSSEAEVESDKIRKGTLTDEEWAGLTKKVSKLSAAPIFIDDTSSLSVLELRAKCRRLKSQGKLDLVIIDYLQLMSGGNPNMQKGGNREQEIAYISRSLKQLAKELSVPVIALSQLSRAVEQRGGDKTPQLSDLRESGSLEQDADMVMFLHRPAYYGQLQDEQGNSLENVGNVIVAKHRAGATDTITLKYVGRYTKFEDAKSIGGDFDSGFGGGFGGFGGGGFGGGSGIPSEFGAGAGITVKSGLNKNKGNGGGDSGSNPINPLDNVPF